jgi:hypothetical protein
MGYLLHLLFNQKLMAITSIIDVPRKNSSEADLFGIDRYQSGLIKFIENSDTPITIAIQGEWGSGKTSLMNTLQDRLCGDLTPGAGGGSSPFYGIWVNTWQYSLLNNQEETLVSIVSSIGTQVVQIIDARHKSDLQKTARSLLNLGGKLLKSTGAVVASTVGGDIAGKVVDTLLEQEESRQSIKQLRDNLQNMIEECLQKDTAAGTPKKGFLVFVDDLDRIDPPLAVQILELLKNIFDIRHCIFVLAIDYDVVIKGLKPKFGELTEKNEREFRSFFDKIIQMPFSMPVASYGIDTFLIENLKKVGYLTEEQSKRTEITETLSQICNLSVGTNPRSLKRLMNTVSLITIIGKETTEPVDSDSDEATPDHEMMLNFALICIQVSYPILYKALCMESNFGSWGENLARSLNLRDLKPEEVVKLDESELFNDPWEKILFRICERDTYLSNRVVQISQLFNVLIKLIPEGVNAGDLIGELLALSSVTDIQAFDKPKQAINPGPVLRVLSGDLISVLSKNLNKRWPLVRQQGKRIVTQLHIAFEKVDWGATLSFQVYEKKGPLMLVLWQHPWLFQGAHKDMAFWDVINKLGIDASMQALKSDYEKLVVQHPGFVARYEPFSSFGRAKDFIVPHLTYEYHLQQLTDLQNPEHLQKIAAFIFDYMECWRKLRAINDEVSKRS